MRAWLHALLLLSVVLVFGASFALLSTVIGITSPWLALLLMFYFLGIAKIAEPLYALRMPGALYQLRSWEQKGDILRRLRVPGFGRMLRHTPLRYLNAGVYLAQQRGDVVKLRRQIESSEAAHFWATVLFTPFIAVVALSGRWGFVACFSFAQVLVNIYPILHLRYIRGRLDRTTRRVADREEKAW
ncbi:hypothetical protein [Duganella sp. Dugasp56]|uniref:glycosyl-4,4'-diaponeurosporenoate acyltransferase CrtO family protein n=1 Tax=Duganella sp. Dugasp56 TaxID=3243046 RepID=UPI0039B1066C